MIVHHCPVAQPILGARAGAVRHEADYYRHPELGRSTYDPHSDGERRLLLVVGRRPILNMRPEVAPSAIATMWQFPRRPLLVDWLDAERLRVRRRRPTTTCTARASRCSTRYSVVLTGSHPEYWSERMLDALEDYVAEGGRADVHGRQRLLLGRLVAPGEAVRDGGPQVRGRHRAPGRRSPGEYYLTRAASGAGSGAPGRPPQKLSGVGFTSEGFDFCGPTGGCPTRSTRRAAWIFDGVGDDEVIGDFGLARRRRRRARDRALRPRPRHAAARAAAGHRDGLSDNYPGVHEDILFNYPA